MYGEWMDAIPLLVSGCPENNITQLRRAQEYYRRHGDNESVNELEQRIVEELRKIS